MLYIIQKPALFGTDNMPIPGQCELHTMGWRLYHVDHGSMTLLFENSYYVCRQMQQECSGHDFTDAKKIVARLAQELTSNTAEDTVRMGALPADQPEQMPQ